VTIFEDEKGNHIVTSLPTMVTKSDKAKYEVKQVESDSEIDANLRFVKVVNTIYRKK
jgi:hypothetical protein